MPPTNLEILGTYLEERYRFENPSGDTIIGQVTALIDGKPRRITIKGVEDSSEPTIGNSYRFYGKWVNYKNRRTNQDEKQFAFQSFVEAAPLSQIGVVKYLQQVPGIGKALSSQLWSLYKEKAVEELRERPSDVAYAMKGLSLDVAKEASDWLVERQAVEACTIDLMDVLTGRGFGRNTAKLATRAWGNKAAELIRRNPFLLLNRFPNCGFKRCDALYLSLKLPPARLKRQALCMWHGVRTNGAGDTWHYHEVAAQALKGSIGGTELRIADATKLAIRGKLLAARYTDGPSGELDQLFGTCCWLAERAKAANENRVAKYTVEAMSEGEWGIDVSQFTELSDHQIEQLSKALGQLGRIAILGGSPGTGKTFTAAQLIRYLIDKYGFGQVEIAAPTGKAAVRISEVMASYGVTKRATTIHSLLGGESGGNGEGWSFLHHRRNRLQCRFLIVDESSMIDADLMADLLAARHRDCCVLFIGDVNQLAPVGHGAPLRDMISAGVPYGELREIRRNSGMVVEACAAIRDQRNWNCLAWEDADLENPEHNLISLGGETAEGQATLLEHWLVNLRDAEGNVDPVWDAQVLVAVNERSQLARSVLNQRLQTLLNPNPAVPGWPFRMSDKVVCLQNGSYIANKQWVANGNEDRIDGQGRVRVANGEVGRVVAFGEKCCTVELSAPERLVDLYQREKSAEVDGASVDGENKGALGEWDLAYALSVHKSQGSEWPIVFVVLDEYHGASRVCDRSWFYTAISRMRKRCYLIGRVATARKFCLRSSLEKRKTFLKELIEAEVAGAVAGNATAMPTLPAPTHAASDVR